MTDVSCSCGELTTSVRVCHVCHPQWFKPYAAAWYAAWYAWSYLGEDLARKETEARLKELLALERAA